MPKYTLYAYTTNTLRCEVEASNLTDAIEAGKRSSAWTLDEELDLEPTHLVIDENGNETHLDLVTSKEQEHEAELPEEEP